MLPAAEWRPLGQAGRQATENGVRREPRCIELLRCRGGACSLLLVSLGCSHSHRLAPRSHLPALGLAAWPARLALARDRCAGLLGLFRPVGHLLLLHLLVPSSELLQFCFCTIFFMCSGRSDTDTGRPFTPLAPLLPPPGNY